MTIPKFATALAALALLSAPHAAFAQKKGSEPPPEAFGENASKEKQKEMERQAPARIERPAPPPRPSGRSDNTIRQREP